MRKEIKTVTEYIAVMSGGDHIGYSDSSTITGGIDGYFGGNDCLWCLLHKNCKKCSDVWATADTWHDKKAD